MQGQRTGSALIRCAVIAACLAPMAAGAQAYPAKPVRLIVPYTSSGLLIVGGTPEQRAGFLCGEVTRNAELIRAANIKLE